VKARTFTTHRRGFTLIELLVALSLFAVLLPLSGWLIYLLLHAQTASANSIAEALTRSRFARTFRGDVHAATKADVIDSGLAIGSRTVFHIDPSTSITYETQEHGVVARSVRVGDRVERREEFPFWGIQTRFEQQSARGTVSAVQSRITSHDPRTSQTNAAVGTVRIEAMLGRDRRLLDSSASESKGKT
jgi:prepilin-type N-terminal cleavage/methylation domain-containing protein